MGTLWYGGNIYTLQSENDRVEAIFTRADRIIALGTEADLRMKYENELERIIDLQGATMLPGFVDSHMHLIGHGEKLIRLDMSSFTTKSAALAALKEYATGFSPGEWIIGEGWNENLWEEPVPIYAHEIDEAVPDHPVILKRICRHAISANSKALQLSSINADTTCPPGGVIEKDEKGYPNGLLKDQAQDILLNVIPAVSDEYMRKAMRAAIRDAHKLGLTGGHTEDLNYYGGYAQTYRTFHDIIEQEGLRFRVHLLVHHEVVDDMAAAGNQYLSGGKWIEFGAMKLFADGALGGRTALLSHPYNDDPAVSGVAIFTQEQLNGLILKARQKKLPVAIHAIGDLAFEMALNAIEKHPLTVMGRDRLIHGQILRKELIDRAKQLPLILDIQPRFVASDFPWVVERIGAERMKYCYAWKTLLNEGVLCAGGSDAPIEPLNPLLGIHAAVTRTNLEDPEEISYYPEEALTIYEAVSLFTKGSAFAACHEDNRGMLQEGFIADFTILKEDIFKVGYGDIPNISVVKTVIGGEIVYGD